MYAAVWWYQAKSWSIIDTTTIEVGDCFAGCQVYAAYKGKLHEAKVLRVSGDFQELSDLKVNNDGTLQHSLKALRAEFAMKKMLSSRHTAPNRATSMNTGVMSGGRGPMPTATPEVVSFLRQMASWLEAGFDSASDGRWYNGRNHLSAAASDAPSTAAVAPPSFSGPQPSMQESVAVFNPSVSPTAASDVCLLHVGHSVQISRKVRSSVLKVSSNPEEMVRRLVTELVGKDALVKMRPRGHGESEFTSVPPHIMAAIDDFVLDNTKKKNFTKGKVTKAVSNFIDKLRNPKRTRSAQGKDSNGKESSEERVPAKKRKRDHDVAEEPLKDHSNVFEPSRKTPPTRSSMREWAAEADEAMNPLTFSAEARRNYTSSSLENERSPMHEWPADPNEPMEPSLRTYDNYYSENQRPTTGAGWPNNFNAWPPSSGITSGMNHYSFTNPEDPSYHRL